MVNLALLVRPETVPLETKQHLAIFFQNSAARIQSYVRAEDLLVKFMEEELMIVLVKSIPLERACKIAIDIVNTLQQSIKYQPMLALRVGISIEPDVPESIEQKLQKWIFETNQLMSAFQIHRQNALMMETYPY